MAAFGATNSVNSFFHSWFAGGHALGKRQPLAWPARRRAIWSAAPNYEPTGSRAARRSIPELRAGHAVATRGPAAAEKLQGFRHLLAARQLAGDRARPALPDCLYPPAVQVRAVSGHHLDGQRCLRYRRLRKKKRRIEDAPCRPDRRDQPRRARHGGGRQRRFLQPGGDRHRECRRGSAQDPPARPAASCGARASTRPRSIRRAALDAQRPPRSARRPAGPDQGQYRNAPGRCPRPPAASRSATTSPTATRRWSRGCAPPARSSSARPIFGMGQHPLEQLDLRLERGRRPDPQSLRTRPQPVRLVERQRRGGRGRACSPRRSAPRPTARSPVPPR